MSELRERLWKELLPALYRVRDSAEGEPLRALLGVIETQLQAVEDNIGDLYEDWFIETCAPWVVPYLADLLGVEGVRSEEGYSRRAYVANTLSYRRRKGTAAVMESLAFSVTGWQARAVEFFQRLATTQHSNHIRLQNQSWFDARKAERAELVGGPFEVAAHTAEVRRIATASGRYNIPNLGIYLWRIQPYLIQGTTARLVGSDATRAWYRFEAIGRDIPLFNGSRSDPETTHLATELDVPGRLRARALGRALMEPDGEAYAWWFASSEPAFRVIIDAVAAEPEPTTPGVRKLQIFHRWRREDPAEEEAVNDWPNMVPGPSCALVDPERGRLVVALDGGPVPTLVTLDHRYGFSGEVGGGPYDRSREMGEDWPLDADATQAVWHRGVSAALTVPDVSVFGTLTDALAAWDAAWASGSGPKVGLITMMDSRTYVEDVAVNVPEGAVLWIVSAGWELPLPDSGFPLDARVEGLSVVLSGVRAHVRGRMTVTGATDGRLILHGLRLEGDLIVAAGDLAELRLAHSTVVPGAGTVQIQGGTSTASDANANLLLQATRAILPRIDAVDTVPQIRVEDSLVDRDAAQVSLQAAGADLTTTGATWLGSVSVRQATLASNCLFVGRLFTLRRQNGCVRYSYFPPESQTPRAFRCQPELALISASADLYGAILDRVQPTFTSTVYGDPGYGQLRSITATELRAGADDGDEMGAFHFLKQTARETNLRSALAQYLRGGLQAGLFYVT